MNGSCPSCGGSAAAGTLTCPQCGADVGWYIKKPDGQLYGPMNRATLERCITEARLVAGDEIRHGPTGEFISAQERLGDRLRKPPAPVPPVPAAAAAASGAAVAGGGASLAQGCGIAVAICVGLGAVIFLVSIPIVRRGKIKSQQSNCLSNLKQISLGALMYAQDYDEKFPYTADWETVTDPYIKNRSLFECPAYRHEPGYAHNIRLHEFEQKNIGRPAETALYWDAGARVPGMMAPAAATAGRHNQGDNFAYTDGHVKWLGTPSVSTVRVDPAPASPSTPRPTNWKRPGAPP